MKKSGGNNMSFKIKRLRHSFIITEHKGWDGDCISRTIIIKSHNTDATESHELHARTEFHELHASEDFMKFILNFEKRDSIMSTIKNFTSERIGGIPTWDYDELVDYIVRLTNK